MNIKKKNREELRIDLTPMVDVVFLLIIFFLVATTFKSERVIDINLAQSSSEKKIKEAKEIIINVDKSGKYYYRNQLITLDDLDDYFKNSDDKEKVVSIRADKDSAYITIVNLMNRLQKLKISNIEFITK